MNDNMLAAIQSLYKDSKIALNPFGRIRQELQPHAALLTLWHLGFSWLGHSRIWKIFAVRLAQCASQ